jgi:hypothetical protein
MRKAAVPPALITKRVIGSSPDNGYHRQADDTSANLESAHTIMQFMFAYLVMCSANVMSTHGIQMTEKTKTNRHFGSKNCCF